MPVALKTHADIASALKTLGVTLDSARILDPATSKDKDLALALKTALVDISGVELARLQATVGAGGDPSSTAARTTTGTSPAHVVARLPTKHQGRAPDIQSNPPAVAVLLERYDVDHVVDRPLERVLVHVAKVDEMLRAETDPAKLVEAVMKADLRRYVFLLEGIGKLYGERYDDAGGVEKKCKRLEDTIGKLSAARSNLAYARQVKVPAQVEKHLVKGEADARNTLQELLVDKWMPQKKNDEIPAVNDIVKDLTKLDWDSYEDDKKYVRKELVRRLTKVSDTDFNMEELETGIHEMRRQLRWFPIYTESVNGLIQLDPTKNPVEAYKPMLDVALATSKYVDIPDDAREVDAIHISKSLYTALMQLTLDLGGIKDAGEPMHALFDAYQQVGLATDAQDARKQVVALVGQQLETDVFTHAAEQYAKMKSNKLVEKLAEQVKKG